MGKRSINVDAKLIEDLYSTISDWQQNKARSQEGLKDEVQFESDLDSYLNELNRFEKEYGIRKIGEGRDRITFTGGSVVESETEAIIKISKSGGYQQNDQEIKVWNKLEGTEAEELVAHLYNWSNDRKWIIQEQVNQRAPPSATRELINSFNDLGWVCSDIRPDNVGVRDGDPVLMDLGIGIRKK